MSKSVEFKVSLRDELSKGLNTIIGGIKKLDDAFKKVTDSTKKVSNSFKSSFSGADKDIKKTIQSVDQLKAHLKDITKKRNISIDDKEIKHLNHEIDNTKKKLKELQSGGGHKHTLFGEMFKAQLAAFSVEKGAELAIDLGKEVVAASIKRETLMTRLTMTSGGNKEEAARSMEDIVEVTKHSAFSVDEMAETFVNLKAKGIDPTKESLKQMGDIGAYFGKSIDEVGNIVQKASVGAYKGLKGLGIEVKKTGEHNEKLALTFHGVTKVIDNNSAAVKEYILSMGNLADIEGSMAKMGDTTAGAMKQLTNSWDEFLVDLGNDNDGVFKKIINGLTDLLDVIDDALFRKGKYENKAKNEIYTEERDIIKEGKKKKLSDDSILMYLQRYKESEFRTNFYGAIDNANLAIKYTNDKKIDEAKTQSDLSFLKTKKADILEHQTMSMFRALLKTETKKPETKKITPTNPSADITQVHGNSPHNIYINIQDLVKELKISTVNMKEGAAELEEIVAKILTGAVNQVSLVETR